MLKRGARGLPFDKRWGTRACAHIVASVVAVLHGEHYGLGRGEELDGHVAVYRARDRGAVERRALAADAQEYRPRAIKVLVVDKVRLPRVTK